MKCSGIPWSLTSSFIFPDKNVIRIQREIVIYVTHYCTHLYSLQLIIDLVGRGGGTRGGPKVIICVINNVLLLLHLLQVIHFLLFSSRLYKWYLKMLPLIPSHGGSPCQQVNLRPAYTQVINRHYMRNMALALPHRILGGGE